MTGGELSGKDLSVIRPCIALEQNTVFVFSMSII